MKLDPNEFVGLILKDLVPLTTVPFKRDTPFDLFVTIIWVFAQ